jgi:hypothetical protein
LAIMATPAVQASVPGDGGRAARTTGKSLNEFARCFVSSQDRASRAWWFVPTEDGGGTFSNSGSGQDHAVYFLRAQHSGTALHLRLESAVKTEIAIGPVIEAVDSCI